MVISRFGCMEENDDVHRIDEKTVGWGPNLCHESDSIAEP